MEGRGITVIDGSYVDVGGDGTYIVVAGDTLSKIAAMYGITWEDLFDLNTDTISDPNLINIGQSLVTP